MSASLVGSEMCIRDSSQTTQRVPAVGSRAAERDVPVVGGRRQRVGGNAPVSYTHLTLPTICSV
eukprot:7637251-Alexandrium_andersonii.AAC.1